MNLIPWKAISLVAVLLILFAGCKRGPVCGEDDGDEIGCYYLDPITNQLSDYPVRYCSKKDPPPCDCLDAGGQLRDIDNLFEQECNGCVNCNGSGGLDIEVDEPYRMDCIIGAGDDICPEYNEYFFDFTDASYDPVTRPVFAQWAVTRFDLNNKNYRFEIISDLTNDVVYSKTISKDQIDDTFLRSIYPSSCDGDPCSTTGIVKMDVKNARERGTYILSIQEVDRNSPSTFVELDKASFQINDIDTKPIYDRRVLDMLVFKHGTFDLSQYSIGVRNWKQAIEHVFGSGRANLRFNVPESRLIPNDFIDSEGDLMLDIEELRFYSNPSNPDFSAAFWDWVTKLYDEDPDLDLSLENDGFIVDINFMKAYSLPLFGSPEVIPDNDEFVATADVLYPYLGVTYSNGGQISAGFAFQKNIARTREALFNGENYSVSELTLRTMLHEIGHMWSSSSGGGAGNDCFEHTKDGKGKGYGACLWQTYCVGLGASDLTIEEYFQLNVENPRFCEGHQQVFMNQLKIK